MEEEKLGKETIETKLGKKDWLWKKRSKERKQQKNQEMREMWKNNVK